MPQDLYPSEIRERALEDHRTLRQGLARIRDALERDPADPQRILLLRRACGAMIPAILNHIHFDEALLAPALWEADAWGDVRSALLEAHHATQRVDLRFAIDQLSRTGASDAAVIAVANRFLLNLERDLSQEARVLLGPEVLRDDVIAIGASCG